MSEASIVAAPSTQPRRIRSSRLRIPRPRVPRLHFPDFSLVWKVAFPPALTLLLLALMLTVALRMGEHNTAALRALDRDVFEPLNRAQTIKDGITLIHTRLFALLSIGSNEANSAAQTAGANELTARLDVETADLDRFLDTNGSLLPANAAQLRGEFGAYAVLVRECIKFATYDPSYGALLAGGIDDRFNHLRGGLDDLVQALAVRRSTLAQEAVDNSLDAERKLLALSLGAALLAAAGSALVARSIARPVLRLTALMKRLADGNTDLPVPGVERSDEVGAMARAVEIFRANAIARRVSDYALQRTNALFDAALNSMMQGMLVYGADDRVQLVNGRYFAIFGLPPGSIIPGMSVHDIVDSLVVHDVHPGTSSDDLYAIVNTLLRTRASMRREMEIRVGQFVQLATEPMADGGVVITFEDVTEKHRSAQEIVFMARHDALTKLPNRALFQEHLETMIAERHDSREFAVLCLDLDHFKNVNDTLGHAAGDALLRLVSGRLRECVRDRDLVARLGGDEFAIALASTHAGPVPADSIAARIVEAIAAPYELGGHTVVIGTSIGIALSRPSVSSAELLQQSDVALYRAKEERGGYIFYERGMDEQLHARREIEADLRLAVQRNEFELHYQPLYNLVENRVSGLEALVRWNSPTRGRVPPDQFIMIAEQTGLIVPIGEWVLRTACAEAALWPDDVSVAVNLSPMQFRDKRLLALVGEALEQDHLPPRRLVLEVTETAMLQDIDVVTAAFHALHDLGVQISMDDFGTGYSSLSHLHRFPFDKIKIDRSFIRNLRAESDYTDPAFASEAATANSALVILRAIIGLGQNLHLSITAEGVETAQQLAQVTEEGCTEVQGYFISPPRPAAEVPTMLQRLNRTLPVIVTGRGALPQRIA